MKDIIKVFKILLVGMLVAVIIYPFLHEFGHILAALLVGWRVYEIQLFPVPYIICEEFGKNRFEGAIIGVSGMLFPFLVSFLLDNEKFWSWLIALFLRVISALAFALSYIAILCYESDVMWKNEDIVTTMETLEISSSYWLVMMLMCFCLAVSSICFNEPTKRIETFFGL